MGKVSRGGAKAPVASEVPRGGAEAPVAPKLPPQAKAPPSKKARVAEPIFEPSADLDEDPEDTLESDEHEQLPEVRASVDQLWAEIAVVRASAEFEWAVYNPVADEEVVNTFTGWTKPRGGVNIQIARAFSSMCGDVGSACSAGAIVDYGAGQHPLQILSAADRSSFMEFFTQLYGASTDAQREAEEKGITLTSATSCELANMDALFFTPCGYSYLIGNKKVFCLRDHVASIAHLMSYPDGNQFMSVVADAVAAVDGCR